MNELWTRMEREQRLSLDEVNGVAQKWFIPNDAWVLILVGPRAEIEAQFPIDDYPIQWATPEDAILGSI